VKTCGLRKPQQRNILKGYIVIKILKQGMIAGLLAAPFATAPAVAQTGGDGQQVRTRTNTVPGRVPSGRPVQSAEPSRPKQGPPEVSQVKVPKSIKAAYYCTVDVEQSTFNSPATTEQRQFTISALDDGSLVYGGNGAIDRQHRFSLVDEGDWRVMKIIGWIEGIDPGKSSYLGKQWEWSVSPRIQRNTGEFSASSTKSFGGLKATTVYEGTCSGGV
jgi:hypothetical protein